MTWQRRQGGRKGGTQRALQCALSISGRIAIVRRFPTQYAQYPGKTDINFRRTLTTHPSWGRARARRWGGEGKRDGATMEEAGLNQPPTANTAKLQPTVWTLAD